jgi:methylthioribose-1-phosphate isomerase
MQHARATLHATRPTAVNLRWALDRVILAVASFAPENRAEAAWSEALAICEEDVLTNHAIGRHALELFRSLQAKKADPSAPLNIMTHCNAGWIACVDWGTAISPIYQAHDAGVPLQVWVDETRPRNQGLLTAWELAAHGVPHTLIVDNAGGHLMQHGQVDLVIVGADRVTARGDVCNKIGTYLKALAAHDNRVPFYAAVPSPTIDWQVTDGLREIPIEDRDGDEVRVVAGRDSGGAPAHLRLADVTTPVANPAFDVTPARLVTGLITERGVVTPDGLRAQFGIDERIVQAAAHRAA